jgi:peptidoglycan-associated lipoprotein
LNGEVTYTFSLEKKKFLNATSTANTVALGLDKYAYQDDKNTYLHTIGFQGKMEPIEVPIVLPNVFFDLAKWDLRPESKAALDSVYKILLANPNITIELRSHTDFRDTDEKNQVLSQNRAQSCVDYLISKGIKADRLGAVGMGEKEPFAIPDGYKGYGAVDFPAGTVLSERYIKVLPTAKQEVAHQINRRTDFKVVRDDYAPPYDPAQEMDAAALAAEEAKKVKVAPKGEFYTVGDKDNFTTICRNTGLLITDLKKLNGGLRGVRVFPGMKLKVTLGGDYAEFDANHRLVQYEETWGSIAKVLELKEKELKALNPDIDDDLLPGMYIRVK